MVIKTFAIHWLPLIEMKYKEDIGKPIDEILKIIQDLQYNGELSNKYKREILDQDKIYD